MGVAAAAATMFQVRTLADQNRELYRVLAGLNRLRGSLAVLLAVLTLGAWVLYSPLHFEQLQLGVALVVLVAISLLLASSVPYLNRILKFAREHR